MVDQKHFIKNLSRLIALLGLVLTSILCFYLYSIGQREFDQRINLETDEVISRIKTRIQRYELALLQARAYLIQISELSNEKFQGYYQRSELTDRYPGLQGLVYVKKLAPEDVKAHTESRKRELPSYKIWPQSSGIDLTTIVYIAPENWRNLRALGFNMMTEPIRRAAMERARDSGEATLSGKVTLLQESGSDTQPGLILYLPIYDEANPKTVAKRRASLSGYITTPYRIDDLFNAIFNQTTRPIVDFEIYEGKGRNQDALLYDYHFNRKKAQKPAASETRVKEFKIHGNSYTAYFYPGPAYFFYGNWWISIIVGFLGILVTILLHRLFSMTQKQMDAKDEFLSIASHELKTPITSLQLQLQMLRRSLAPGMPVLPEAGKVLKSIDFSIYQVNRITRLIDELLEISRINKGKLRFNFEELDVTDLVSEVVSSHSEEMRSAGNTVELTLDEAVMAEVDRFRIEQVISNLITNGIKYGAGTLISISLSKGESSLRLSIRDRGQGIAPELHKRIFEKFERAEFNKYVSGLGLGLYISDQIVRAHHGTLSVESKIGEGANFIMELPYKQDLTHLP